MDANERAVKLAEIELKIKTRLYILYALAIIAGTIIVAFISLSLVPSIAGKKTEFLTDIDISMAFSWILGGAGTVYGLAQGRTRKKIETNLNQKVKQLQNTLRSKGRT